MALIERLMHTDPVPSRNMSIHGFVSFGFEIVFGDRTRAEAKSYYNMTQEDEDEFDDLADTITGNDNAKLKKLFEIERVLMCGEDRMDWYDTEAKVRTRLGI